MVGIEQKDELCLIHPKNMARPEGHDARLVKNSKAMHRPGVEPGSYSSSLMGTVDDNRYTSGAVVVVIPFRHEYD